MAKKYRLSLDENEQIHLEAILNRFTEYMGGDERQDHGLKALGYYRTAPSEVKQVVYDVYVRLSRLRRR